VRRAQLEGELDAERRLLERVASERAEHAARVESLRARRTGDLALTPSAARLARAIEDASDAASSTLAALQAQLAGDRSAGAEIAEALRECAHDEAEVQSRLRVCAEGVTEAELEAQRTVASASETEAEVRDIARRLELPMDDDELARGPALPDDQLAALALRLERIGRRRDQLGPVNPLAGEQYADAQAHVEEIVGRREDLEAALRELRSVIGEADRQIRETFDDTFHKVAHNFQDVIGDVFPDGSGRLRLVEAEIHSAPVLGDAAARPLGAPEEDLLGVEIEVTPAGKTTKRMSLLSGGEKSMAALAFLFAVFMARPCPFYVLDEVEAALDDLNLDRFLALLRRCATRAQFIVMTHQRLTMQAANWLYGVSMGGDGVSKVISRRLDGQDADTGAADRDADGPSGTALAPAEAVRLAGELQALST
jgi:chromosome segregation protein